MAPIKRARRAVDDDDHDEIVHVQEARSSLLQSASRKRPRLSIEEPKSPSRAPSRLETTAPPSDGEGDNDSDAPDSPPQTQYEIMRDAGFKHLQNLDWDDQQATQKLMRRPTQLGNNMVAEGGIVESITCYNFMCHERLHVELGPLINFVVGENGSGKSAVLTALTLCLGGKASDTNRGGSLKSFVKEGRDHGSLVVKIKNGGSDAYQPDLYGDCIVVERHFSKTGSSGFRIKSATGRIISTKKHEVDEISEWYALQINNPLTVLSQDNARQFLNSATPAQKYKYFVSGVQLEQLDNDYKLSQDTLDKTLLLRDDLDDTVRHVEKEMQDAKRLAETAQKNQNLREKKRLYRNQLIWSQVVEQEMALEARNADLQTRDQGIAQAQGDCEEMSTALLGVEEKLARVTAAREGLDEERGTLEENISVAEAAYHASKRELTDLHREERDAFSRLKTIKDGIAVCEDKIKDEERRLDESTGSARAEKDTELSAAKAQEAELNEKISDRAQQQSALQLTLTESEKAWRQGQQLKDLKRKDIVQAEQHLRELERSTGSRYDGFDRDIAGLVKAIEGDSGFEHKPVGPMGAHIRLGKPEWSGILEKTLGEVLNAFIVKSKRDQTRLSGLVRRAGMKKPPPIYIAYGGRIDTRSQEPLDELDTILRVLEFDDDLVRSQLIINSQIEKIILVKERSEAVRIMVDNGPPRNVAACICFHDGKDKRGHGIRMTNRASGGPTSAPVMVTGQRPRMQSDSGRQVALQKEHLRQLGVELRELNSEERQLQQAVQRHKADLESGRKDAKALENPLLRAQADIVRISEELDAFEGVDDRLVTLREELEATRTEESQLGTQYGNMRLAKRDVNTKTEEGKKKLDAERAEWSEYQARLNKATDKIQSHESLRRIALTNKNNAFEKLDIEKAERRRAEEKRDAKAAEVETFTEEARNLVPDRVHIPDGETHASIEKKYQKVREQLQQREDRLGATDQQIYDRDAEATQRYKDVVRQTQDVDDTIKSLKRAITHRLHLWRQFQRQISARIRIQFNYLLSERGFRGKIDLDHENKKVNLQIEPDETRKSSSGRNTKTLSGGEKSFSSICMLLSVWEAIGSPIRCLDEFDVFMDNVNRAISTNMLVDTARRSVSRQYILITPNAIEGRARLDKDVKIIRLTDPRQRTLV